MFGLTEENVRNPAANLTSAVAKLTSRGVKLGALPADTPPIIFRNPSNPGQEFAELINKGSMLLETLFSRLLFPNDPRFGFTPRGPPAFDCISQIHNDLKRAITLRDAYFREIGTPIPKKLLIPDAIDPTASKTPVTLSEIIALIESIDSAMGTQTEVGRETPVNYAEYGIQETNDNAVNFLISMAIVLDRISKADKCKASRISKFSTNTTTNPGKGKLGTLTFRDDVIFVLSYALENREFLDRARKYAELQLSDMIFDAVKLQDLENRLRALRGLRTLPESATIAAMRAAKARLASSGGGGAAAGGGGAGGSYRMGGGAYKNRKTRRNRKARKTNKSRKNRRHQ